MNQTPSQFPASRSEFLKLVEGTKHADVLRDESKLRKIVIDAMKDSDDPITREIGEGLAGGAMSWHAIATTSAYSSFLDQGLTALQQFDFTGLAEDLETKADFVRSNPDDRHRRGDDDGGDLWQGLRRKRR
jgi:hypothetical protein